MVDHGRNWQSAQLALEQGRQRYEQGRYEQALLWLEEALTLGLRNPEDTVEAHKLAAFIACVQSRPGDCRRHFTELLAIDPDFELARAEVGHPMWGPVFSEVKRSATVRCSSEVEAAIVDKAAFRNILLADPRIAERLSENLAAREMEQADRVAEAGARLQVQRRVRDEILGRIRSFFAMGEGGADIG